MKTLILKPLLALAAIGSLFLASSLGAAQSPQILIVVGPSNHPPGSHEVAAGARLMEYCLENMENAGPIPARVAHQWPEDSALLEGVATVVFIGDQFPGERLPGSNRAMRDLTKMMARGCGLVAIHYGVGLGNQDMGPDGDHPLLHWMGGYFAARCDHHQSVARIYREAKIEPADSSHPIARGWAPFTIHDEPYINNYFGPEGNRMLPGAFAVATSMLPPKNPKREVIAWSKQREDGGRGFGVTMPHFYKSWEVQPLRKFILNGIVWTAGMEVPEEGVATDLPGLETFDPVSVEFPARK